MPFSLSTMWAQQARFEDLGLFRDYTAGLGYEAIEVSHSTDEAGLRKLLSERSIAVSSLHAPAPHRVMVDGRRNAAQWAAHPPASDSRPQIAFCVWWSPTRMLLEVSHQELEACAIREGNAR